jgi:hypothetical protein
MVFNEEVSTSQVLKQQSANFRDSTAIQVQAVETGESDGCRWPESATSTQWVVAEAEARQFP